MTNTLIYYEYFPCILKYLQFNYKGFAVNPCCYYTLKLTCTCKRETYAYVLSNAASEKQCDYGELRLMGGDFPNEGRVEVCVDNHWGSICDTSFDSKDARVICSQLDYSDGEACHIHMYTYTSCSPYTICSHAHTCFDTHMHICKHIHCVHTCIHAHTCMHAQMHVHTHIHTCVHTHTYMYMHTNVWTHTCTHTHIHTCTQAHIHTLTHTCICTHMFGHSQCTHTHTNMHACTNACARTVCTHSHIHVHMLTHIDTTTTSLQLCLHTCDKITYTCVRHVGEAIWVEAGYFGAGLGMVWLEQLRCVGNESHLVNCSRGNSNPYSNCRHSNDVSVICPGMLILASMYIHKLHARHCIYMCVYTLHINIYTCM